MLWWTYQQLRSGNVKTRLATVAKLAESKHEDSVEPLLFALKDGMAEVRSTAAMALAQFHDGRMVEPLVKLLRDPVPMVRAMAAQTLGQLQATTVTNELVGLLQDADATVRLRAARSLDHLGWQPEDDALRKLHVLASGNLKRVAELGADGIETLVELMNNGTSDQQLAAIKALSEIGDPRIPRAMQQALTKSNPWVRLAALETLEKLRDPSVYDAVERMFRDPVPNVRAAAVGAAVSCGDNRVVPVLVKLLKDGSWEVRLEAVKALGQLGDVTAVEGLCGVLQDKDHDVRESAALALSRLGDVRAMESLVLALMDSQSFVRTAAHNALFRIDRHWEKSDAAHNVLPQIETARNHRDYWISHSAEKLLAQIQPDSKSAENISTQPVRARETAAPDRRMTNAPHPAFAILTDLLRDPDRDLRLAAVEALGELGDKNAVSSLTAASRDNDAFVRQSAERALAALN
jgi:HEAT repeat protein